jgi:signal transduction histidine kinase
METREDIQSVAADRWLEGGGDMGERIRRFDWTRTPLGHPRTWPQSLRTAVRIMLTSRQAIWLGWGPELTYLYNDPYKSIIGGKHPAALGEPFREVWREIYDVVGPMAQQVMTANEGTYVEAQLLIMERHGYQEETYYTFSYSPIPNDNGEPGGLICYNTDDTRRVIGERELALLRELASRTASARSWSEACALAAQAFGAGRRDIPFASIHRVDAADGTSNMVAASGIDEHGLAQLPLAAWLKSGVPEIHEIDPSGMDLPTGDWKRPPQRIAVIPIGAPAQPSGSLTLVMALNPFRQVDEGYRGFIDLVAGQVDSAIANAQAYEEERRRAEALAELDRAKTAFFSNVSHEFRTPLTLMLGPVEDALREEGEPLSRTQRERLELVRRNGRRMQKLVNALLDFSRIEAGRAQAHYAATDLAALTADLASSFRSAMEKAGLQLRVDCPPLDEPAYVDPDMWEKIVLNLLSNAFKFTFEGGITVSLRRRGENFELKVTDTGTGIPQSQLTQIFERFRRVEGARSRTHEGTGIGLALVQELAKLHGGAVSAESSEGQGSTFTVTLPRGKSHLPAAWHEASRLAKAGSLVDTYVSEAMRWLPDGDAAGDAVVTDEPNAPRAARDMDRARIVWADDNADMREYVRRLLGVRFEVEAVADGEAALEAIRREPPALVLSDVMMPKVDGLTLVKSLRSDPRTRAIPVILLSARAGEEARIEGFDVGADDYLYKPFSAGELLARVTARVELGKLQARIEEERRALVRLFAQTPVATGVLTGPDLVFEMANPAYSELVGGRPLEGKPLLEAVPELRGQGFDDLLREVMRTGEPHVGRETPVQIVRNGQPQEIHCTFIYAPLRDASGAVTGVMVVASEVTAQVRARKEMEALTGALQESDRRKDEFIATLSHELRNPLAPLRNSLHVLRIGGAHGDRGAAILDVMERQVNHLVRLVDDLLEMSRISRGTFELRRERVELSSIVRHAVDTARPLIDAARHHLAVELPAEPLWIDGDPVRVSQILANFLNNAAKYTDPGGRIAVRAEYHAGEVAIRIADNGSGISPEALPRLFEMFSRGERARRGDIAGLGIGLALARRLAQMHGGRVEAKSAGVGLGSEFSVYLPLAGEQSAGPNAGAGERPALPSRRVLIVDDNVDAAETLGMVLEQLGAQTRLAASGSEALAAYEAFDADVVLLDIGMPGMNGYEVARALRARHPDRGAVLVALTGWGQEEDRRRARAAGFDHHLVKPADLGALQQLLATIQPRTLVN